MGDILPANTSRLAQHTNDTQSSHLINSRERSTGREKRASFSFPFGKNEEVKERAKDEGENVRDSAACNPPDLLKPV